MPDELKPAEPVIGQTMHGFVVDRRVEVPETGGVAWIMHHSSSGTPLMWISNDDENMSFAIAFQTPPADDTGVFHILEHSVLCGSEKYPVKEPFVDLLKTSMQTFLNAMTYPDKTMYPVASTNERDLLNLMDVYMDAVLHPRLLHARSVFEQEGWHLEFDGNDLAYNGVVFNEMKGATSDPDDVVVQGLCEALFPQTCYRFESGGDPAAIPSLTYEAFVDAHRRHYNLGNARLFLYGPVSLDEELELLDGYCSAHRAGDVGTPNALELQAPVVDLLHSKTMQSSPDNAAFALGYVIGTFRDGRDVLAADILIDALLGSNEAPLKRALLDQDIADDVEAFVYDGVLQPFVVLEMRGCSDRDCAEFPGIVDALVKKAVDEGLPRENLEASLESFAFSLREREYGYADGVAIASSALSSWLYDADDPCGRLAYEGNLEELRLWLDDGRWESFARSLFLENAHRGACELACIPDGPQTPSARERAALADLLASMDDKAREDVRANAEGLRRIQATPDDPRDTEKLPRLTPHDVGPARPQQDYYEVQGTPRPCLYHEVATRRIDYAFHYYDLSGLMWDELPWASLLASLLGHLDTDRHDAAELDRAIESRLGRLSFACSASIDFETDEPTPRLIVAASSLEENVADLASLPAEVWSSTCFDDVDRIKRVLVQQRIDAEQGFAAAGHSHAIARARSYTSRSALLSQHFSSIDYYRFIRGLLENWDAEVASLPEKLEDIRSRIFRTGGDLHSFTGARGDLDTFWAVGGDLGLAGDAPLPKRLVIPEPTVLNEGFVIPSDVCFVAKTAGPRYTKATYGGAWTVASRAISLGYLWEEVRVKGGAYGCGMRAYRNGSLAFHSYRSPDIDHSVAAFDAAGAWLRDNPLADRELDGYIVSSVATQDAPSKPRRIAHRQDAEYLDCVPRDWREQIRSQTLATTAKDVCALSESVENVARACAVCAFGNRESIESSSVGLTTMDLLAPGTKE